MFLDRRQLSHLRFQLLEFLLDPHLLQRQRLRWILSIGGVELAQIPRYALFQLLAPSLDLRARKIAVEHPIAGDELRAIKRFLATRTDKLPWLFVSEGDGRYRDPHHALRPKAKVIGMMRAGVIFGGLADHTLQRQLSLGRSTVY